LLCIVGSAPFLGWKSNMLKLFWINSHPFIIWVQFNLFSPLLDCFLFWEQRTCYFLMLYTIHMTTLFSCLSFISQLQWVFWVVKVGHFLNIDNVRYSFVILSWNPKRSMTGWFWEVKGLITSSIMHNRLLFNIVSRHGCSEHLIKSIFILFQNFQN